MCAQQVNNETTRRCRALPAVFSHAFERCSGLTPHKATWSIKSLATKLHSLGVKWLLTDMLVFKTWQNDGLLRAVLFLSLPPCLFFVTFYITRVNTLYTHLEKPHEPLLSLMCRWLLVMRFLQDEKLQGHWLTAHFKHCSLPLPFLSCGTQRMKQGWGRRGRAHCITRGHMLTLTMWVCRTLWG